MNPDEQCEQSEHINALMQESRRPPIGVVPKQIFYADIQRQRMIELSMAIRRYLDAERPVRVEWIVEYNELIAMQ